jgi:hypothetical protein
MAPSDPDMVMRTMLREHRGGMPLMLPCKTPCSNFQDVMRREGMLPILLQDTLPDACARRSSTRTRRPILLEDTV